jgi:hypothetical protein
MDDLLRYLPPTIALWVSDEIEWVTGHSVEITIFLVLAWLLRSASITRAQCGTIAEQLDRLSDDVNALRQTVSSILFEQRQQRYNLSELGSEEPNDEDEVAG